MLKLGLVVAAMAIATTGTAQAACPAEVTGTSAAAIKANGDRLLCLQAEADQLFRERKQDFDIMTLERSVQNLQLQQRMDRLPTFQPYVPPKF
jgi:hypothetical protein